MITSALTVAAALFVATPNLTLAQATAPQTPVQAPAAAYAAPPVDDFPMIEPAVRAADCGGLLRTPAYCVSAPLTEIGTLADQYMQAMEGNGWLVADGDDNRVIFARRQAGGTCDGMQMIAFYDESKPVSPTTVGYLGFAVIPGNICVAPPAQGPSSQ